MKWLVMGLYAVSLGFLVVGLWRVIRSSQEISSEIATVANASVGVAPPGPGALYQMHPELWGQTAAGQLASAFDVTRKGQIVGAWIAAAGGLVGLAATLLALWVT